MKENLHTDKILREKLESFSVQPPPYIWNNVKGQLAAQQRKKRIAYISWLSAAAVIVLAFMAGWYFNNNSEITRQILVDEQSLQTEPEIKIDKNNIYEDKNLNAELIDRQLNNSTIEIENEINSSEAILKVDEEKLAEFEEKSVEINKQRVKIQMLKSIDVWFDKIQQEVFLAEMMPSKDEYILNESDRFLIAENSKKINTSTNSENSWKMGMLLSPGYASHTASHTENYSQNINYSGESGNGNVGGGFSIQYKTSKKLSVESGVYYAQNGQKSVNSFELFALGTKEYDVVNSADNNYSFLNEAPVSGFSNAINVSDGNISMNSTAGIINLNETPKGAEIVSNMDEYNSRNSNSLVSDGEFSQVFDFIEIPLFLRYKIVDSKFGVELVGGVNAGIIVGNNAYIDNRFGLQNIGKTQDISTINLSGALGLGMNYALGKHISVALEPRVNYYFNSINNNPEVDFRPYRLGVFTGVYYEF